ncbi:MAG TPA: hypothetical protein VFI34_09875 [Candidatus Limnocylindrales bacterium]|nr:hypothetical protein [Candidatus Limnocylindrales bacterium]
MDLLQRLEPVSQAYASMPVAEAFTWSDAGTDLGDGEWYLVAFRSVRRADADADRLTRFDELAHQEAATSEGFVHYFKGPLAVGGACLSFCLWQSRADARAAAGRPAHVQAVSLIDEMYASYTLEFHRVTRTAGGPLAFEPYDRPGAPSHVHVTGVDLHPVVDRPAALLPAVRPAAL